MLKWQMEGNVMAMDLIMMYTTVYCKCYTGSASGLS